ncbi:phosphoenolpyruvate--protein phosphotransferase [Alishewanella longhuensis]
MQIRAMVRANIEHQNLHILLPMVSDLAEVDEAIRFIGQACFEVSDELASVYPEPK